MGCGSSSPKVAHAMNRAAGQQLLFAFSEEEDFSPSQLDLPEEVRIDAINILQGLKKVVNPEHSFPVINFGSNSFPIVLSSLLIDEQHTSTIDLPIISIGRLPYPPIDQTSTDDKNPQLVINGRVVVFGTINFLSDANFESPESSAFIENLISWAANFKMQTTKILLLGFPQTGLGNAVSHFNSFGFQVTKDSELHPPLNYDIIFLAGESYLSTMKQPLIDYLNQGNAVFVFGTAGHSRPLKHALLNDFLKVAGISISPTLMHPSSRFSEFLQIEQLEQFNWHSFTDIYLDNLIKNEIIYQATSQDDNENDEENNDSPTSQRENADALDDIISLLKYYINGIPLYSDEVHMLAQKTWKHFLKIGYKDDNGFLLPEMIHHSLALLMIELIPKIPPKFIQSNKSTFPSNPYPMDSSRQSTNCDNEFEIPDTPTEVIAHSLTIQIQPNIWNFTGLFLPPAQTAKVTSELPVIIQIGSHITPLLIKAGPLRRWPSVTSKIFVPSHTEIEFSSPFGGIIYLISDTAKTAKLKFTNCSTYPYYIQGEDETLSKLTSENETCAWGEILTKMTTFVMPLEKIREIEKLNYFSETMNKLINLTLKFVGAKSAPFHHVVFDCETPTDDPYMSDVLVFDLENLNRLIDLTKPSIELHTLLSYICYGSIIDAFFDNESEKTLALVAAAYVIHEEYHDAHILPMFQGGNFQLYDELFQFANTYGSKPIASAMEKLMNNPNLATTAETVKFFVSSLTAQIKKPLPTLIGKFMKQSNQAGTVSDRLSGFEVSPDVISD